MKYRFLRKLALFSLAGLFCLQVSAFARISNKSNLAVQIEIKKTSGFSEKQTLFPGQTISLPDRSKSVTVISISGRSRADEKLEVTVLEENGKEGLLTRYDEVYVLGLSEDDVSDAPLVMTKGYAKNTGSVAVDLSLKTKYGFTQKRTLYTSNSLDISSDIVEVEVMSDQRIRGDQKVQINIMLPDGSTHVINRAGGMVKVADDGF